MTSSNSDESEDEEKKKKKEKKQKKQRKARKKELKKVLKEAKKRKKAAKKADKKRRKLDGSDSDEGGKWVMVNGETVRVSVDAPGSDADSDFEWGDNTSGVTMQQRTATEKKQQLHRSKSLAMQRVDNSASTWRSYAEPLGATGLAAEPGAAAAEAKLANLEASVKIGMAQFSTLQMVRAIKAKQKGDTALDSIGSSKSTLANSGFVASEVQKQKRAARFAKEAQMMDTKFAKPERTFAHAGGKMTTNKEQALQRFIDRKFLAPKSQK